MQRSHALRPRRGPHAFYLTSTRQSVQTRARERARLTGDRYLGSVVARGSLPRRFRICGASSHARVDRAIAYRLWKTRRVRFDTPDRGGVVMTPRRLQRRPITDTMYVWR